MSLCCRCTGILVEVEIDEGGVYRRSFSELAGEIRCGGANECLDNAEVSNLSSFLDGRYRGKLDCEVSSSFNGEVTEYDGESTITLEERLDDE